MSENAEDINENIFQLKMPFWIDEGYTKEQQTWFAYGYEFAHAVFMIEHVPDANEITIHRENESRCRLACGHFGRQCQIEHYTRDQDPSGLFSVLKIGAKSS